MSILVIIPAFNEARAIGQVINDVPDIVDEIVVVNNASTDETGDNARAAGATVVREPNQGYGYACLRGIEYARGKQPDVIVFLDGDYSDHPDEMSRLLAPILEDQADFVVGSRIRGEAEPGAMLPQARIGNRLACVLMRWNWGARYTDLGPFRAIRFRTSLRWTCRTRRSGGRLRCRSKPLRPVCASVKSRFPTENGSASPKSRVRCPGP